MNPSWGELVTKLAELASRGEIADVRGVILDELQKRIPCAGGSFYTFGPHACSDPSTASRGIGQLVLERVTSVWAMQLAEIEGSPLASIAALGVARLDDIDWGEGTARETRTWKEVFEPAGVGDTLAIFVTVPDAAPRLLVLFRGIRERFTVEERDALVYLLPFLALAERETESPVRRLPLTPAQRKIVELLRRGRTNEEIAETLDLSANTVRNQLSVVYGRCGVTNRTELVSILDRPDLIDPVVKARRHTR